MFKLSKTGEMVHRILTTSKASDWDLTAFSLIHVKTGFALTIGLGFWRFDISDNDYISELSLYDKWKLWPLAKSIRSAIKYSQYNV